MKVMLDTNMCIYIIKRRPASALRRFLDYRICDVGISSITYSELRYGVAKSQHRVKNEEALNLFVGSLEIVPFGEDAARAYGDIRATLEKAGTPIGSMDLLIAAHAVSLGVTLVSNITREFSRISGLNLADWSTD